MSSPILDMKNINMRLGPSNMGRCGNGRGVHFGGVTMHPLTVLHPITQATPPCVVGKLFGANHHMFTPLLVDDFHFCQKRSVLPDFLHPPLVLEGGF